MSFNTTELQHLADEALKLGKACNEGANADYIPFLASVPSDLCAVSISCCNGNIIHSGDYDYGFALESISKVCSMSLAMQQKGAEQVREKIGAEPTGLPFNSVMALTVHQDKPLTPLVNAGAMSTVSFLEAPDKESRWQMILDFQRKMMSQNVRLSDDVNTSEQETNFHNRAIAWLLYAAGNCFSDPMDACEVYTRQCSTLISCDDLATLGGTLANGGVNPVTKEKVINPENIAPILAEMTMEGMYDYSGDWAFLVGLPGKSGVGGGVVAVVPGKMAIAGFSPPLDEAGNSARAMKMIRHIANNLNLSVYQPS
ncbi:glutaminase A [Endozoicomonas sp. SCSIO W0465]|uniref:glutaminase A n=1 Tax=Endozoicomonas sp. SCSIO W0465 TaxID=2918516 RepID=UPI002076219F|nr:glutaminase A [Endozoicomonas sp. SCSIO W0465]USE34732.1 glutaminase A [Endozoicomonas sp. SCSIO W0465]